MTWKDINQLYREEHDMESHVCQECGQAFDTIESLKEHQEAERQEKILRSKEIDD
jgi:hypothetical protein